MHAFFSTDLLITGKNSRSFLFFQKYPMAESPYFSGGGGGLCGGGLDAALAVWARPERGRVPGPDVAQGAVDDVAPAQALLAGVRRQQVPDRSLTQLAILYKYESL